MAVKSIVEIDLNDDRFKAFKKLHDQYTEALKKVPAQWSAIGRAQDDVISRTNKRLTVGQQLVREMVDGAKSLNSALAGTEIKWMSLDRITLRVASHIRDATTSILKWSAITGAITGILGAGGLFGIDRLALGVSSTRRSALGLGTDYGARRAFGANFGRLIDPESFLSGVANAKLDVTRRVGLLGAGLSEGELAGDTSQTAVALLRNLKRIADQTNPQLFAQVIQSRRLDQFVSPEDLQRLRNTSPAEFNNLIRAYGQNRGAFDLPGDVALKWQELSTQLGRASQGIENTFIRGLTPLAPGLTRLSESVEKVIKAFLSSPTLEKWITGLDQALEKFAGYIGTDEFQENVRNFVTGIGKLAAAIGSAFGWVTGSDPDLTRERSEAADRRDKLRKDRASGKATAWSQLGDVFNPPPASMDSLLGIVRRLEASGDTAVSPAGAIGRYQITPDTARTYGLDVSRLTDPSYSEAGARKILADLVRRYHGNTDEVLAAYNAGPGAANRYRTAHHDLSVLPKETQRYVTHGQGLTGYSPSVVTIENNTGGNANVSINGLKN